MAGGNKNIKPEDGKQFSSDYQPNKEVWKEDVSVKFFNDLIEWMQTGEEENIFINDFYYLNWIKENTKSKRVALHNLPTYLRDKFSSCSELYEIASEIQKIKLIKYGLFKRLDSNMSKFVLMNIHGMTDKVENKNENTGSTDAKIEINFRRNKK